MEKSKFNSYLLDLYSNVEYIQTHLSELKVDKELKNKITVLCNSSSSFRADQGLPKEAILNSIDEFLNKLDVIIKRLDSEGLEGDKQGLFILLTECGGNMNMLYKKIIAED